MKAAQALCALTGDQSQAGGERSVRWEQPEPPGTAGSDLTPAPGREKNLLGHVITRWV